MVTRFREFLVALAEKLDKVYKPHVSRPTPNSAVSLQLGPPVLVGLRQLSVPVRAGTIF